MALRPTSAEDEGICQQNGVESVSIAAQTRLFSGPRQMANGMRISQYYSNHPEQKEFME